LEPASGRIQYDGVSADTLPESVTGRRVAYVESGPFFSQSSLRDALVYGLRHAPLRALDKDETTERRRRAEAVKAGNTDLDIHDDWIDYEAAGATGPEDLLERIREVLVLVDLEDEVYRQGLRSKLPADTSEAVLQSILAARADFRARLEEAGAERYVETFDPERYANNASVLENLIFGEVVSDALGGQLIERHPYMLSILKQTGLEDRLLEMGRQIAETLIELFGDMAGDNPLLERMDLLSAQDIDLYRTILRRVATSGMVTDPTDRQALFKLAFGYIEPRHRLGLLDDSLRDAILAARKAFRANLPEELEGAIYFHEPGAINLAASVQDNVLFGRVVDIYADASQRTTALLQETLDALDLSSTIIELGLATDIGSGAKRLSPAQRQKLALARALLKRPDLLIVNRALSALDAEAQEAIIKRVLDNARGPEGAGYATFWVLNNPAHSGAFDKVVTFENGRLVDRVSDAPSEALEAAQ
jgi:putative ABC transport system ATP-binding protein